MDFQLLALPAHAAIIALHRFLDLGPRDRQQLVLQAWPHPFHVQIALLRAEAQQVGGIPLQRVLGVERQDGVDDVVGVDPGIQVAALGGRFQRQVVHGEIHRPLHLVHVGVVIGLAVVAGAARVFAGLDLAPAAHGGARVAVDDHVGQVDAHHVLRGELFLECLQREQPPLVHELADARHRILLADMERQHRVGHRAVGDLLVDAEHMAAPVAARRHRTLGVDGDLGAAAGALEAHQAGRAGVDVARARGDDGAAQLVDAFAQPERFLHPRAVPLVAAVLADQQVGAELEPDIGGAALRAAVQAVAELGGGRVQRHRIRRLQFFADGAGQGRRIDRKLAGQGRHVAWRAGAGHGRRRQRRRGLGVGHGRAASRVLTGPAPWP